MFCARLALEDPSGASEWADTVIATIPADADPIVIVGHSLAGLCLPVIASRLPVDRLVFLGAMVPVPGLAYVDVLAAEPDAIKAVNVAETIRDNAAPSGGHEVTMPFEQARALFYGDLDDATAQAAWQRLRPQGMTVFTEKCPLDTWPDVASTYVLMTEDGAVGQDWSRRVAAGRLGADLIELPGSHSPFYRRPTELAELLSGIARR
jgi:hypothetical protein